MKKTAYLLVFTLVIAQIGLAQEEIAKNGIKKVVLDNGMTVIIKENRANDIVAFELFIKAGLWTEDKNESGIRNFVQHMLLKGTEKRSAEDIALETESLGIRLSTTVGEDYCEIYMKSTKEFYDEALDILADITMNSVFDPEEIEKERNIVLAEIKFQEDNMFEKTHKLFLKTLYDGHPYGSPLSGEEETVRKLDRESLVDFYKKYYTPNNMVLVIVGNVKSEEAISIVKESFKGFESKETPPIPILKVKSPEKKDVREKKEREQLFILIGYLGPEIQSKEYPALKVLNSILGVGMSSRLFVELRDKRGLAYEVGSFYPSRRYESYLTSYIATTPQNELEVEKYILEEFEKTKKNITMEELERGKKKLIGLYIIRHESNKDQAWFLAWYETLGIGYGYDEEYLTDIEKVTAEDVLQVANKYLEGPVIARVGP